MTFHGADTEQLRETASVFERSATSLDVLLTALAGVVGATDWQGQDADSFRANFDQLHRAAGDTTSRVAERAARLRAEADEQDEVSSSDGGAPSAGFPFDEIRKLFGGADGSGGPGDAYEEIRDHAKDILEKVADRVSDSPDTPSWAKRLVKAGVPAVSAIPEMKEMYQHLSAGETGLAIGDGFEIVWGAAPHPVAEAGSAINEHFTGPGENDISPFERWGQIQAESFGAKYGEKVGGDISALIGFEDGSTADNLLTSGGGVLGWTTYTGFAPTSFLNQASGVWNSRD